MWRRTQKKLIKEAVHKPEMMPEMIQEAERKENLKARRKEYRESEKGKAAIKKWEKIYNGKAARKASRKKYQQSAKGKAARKAASRKFAQALHPRARNAILIQAGLADIKSQAKTRAAKKAIKVTEKKMKSQFRRKEIITWYRKKMMEAGRSL